MAEDAPISGKRLFAILTAPEVSSHKPVECPTIAAGEGYAVEVRGDDVMFIDYAQQRALIARREEGALAIGQIGRSDFDVLDVNGNGRPDLPGDRGDFKLLEQMVKTAERFAARPAEFKRGSCREKRIEEYTARDLFVAIATQRDKFARFDTAAALRRGCPPGQTSVRGAAISSTGTVMLYNIMASARYHPQTGQISFIQDSCHPNPTLQRAVDVDGDGRLDTHPELQPRYEAYLASLRTLVGNPLMYSTAECGVCPTAL